MAQLAREVGRQLRTARLARGLTVEALAEAAGASARHVRRIEAGQCVPGDRLLTAWLRVTGRTLTVVVRAG